MRALDGAAGDHAELLALQAELAHQAVEGGGEHFLIADLGVRLVLFRERMRLPPRIATGRSVRVLGALATSISQGGVCIYSVFFTQQ